MTDLPFFAALALSAVSTAAYGYQLCRTDQLKRRNAVLLAQTKALSAEILRLHNEKPLPFLTNPPKPRDLRGRFIPTTKQFCDELKKARLNESLRRFRAQHTHASITHEQMEKRLND